MQNSKVSFRYANSLLENSVEKKNLETVSEDIEFVNKVLNSSKELKHMLQSPVIKPQIKSTVLSQVFEKKISSDAMNFLMFIIDKSREYFLEDILAKFIELKNEHLGILNVEVTTAVEFSEEQKEELKKTFESKFSKKIIFQFKIDNSVIGGFIARVADTLYDASIRHQLEILKKQFLQGSASLN